MPVVMEIPASFYIKNKDGEKVQKKPDNSHTQHRRQMVLVFQGRDSWDRPVYKGPDGNLYVDVDPRKGWGPNICTKCGNEFDGEPDDPVRGVDFLFTPCWDVW